MEKGRLYVYLMALALALAAFLASAGRVVVSGPSMEPTYRDGQTVWVDRHHRDLSKGDVGVFFEGDEFIIKRVRAVAGEAVWEVDAGAGLWRPIEGDDLARLRRTIAHEAARRLPCGIALRRTAVPPGCVYIQGDNFYHTIFGLRRLALVYGKVMRT